MESPKTVICLHQIGPENQNGTVNGPPALKACVTSHYERHLHLEVLKDTLIYTSVVPAHSLFSLPVLLPPCLRWRLRSVSTPLACTRPSFQVWHARLLGKHTLQGSFGLTVGESLEIEVDTGVFQQPAK